MSHRTGLPSNAIAPVGSKHVVEKNPNIFPYSDKNITTYRRQADILFKGNLLFDFFHFYLKYIH